MQSIEASDASVFEAFENKYIPYLEVILKGHWTTSVSYPNFCLFVCFVVLFCFGLFCFVLFFQKRWDFHTIRIVYLRSDCMLNFTCNFNLFTKKYEFSFQ